MSSSQLHGEDIDSDDVADGGQLFSETLSATGYDGHPQQPELTPRQRQILELLQAGKVNKEIANELGIGVGTVKQHVVALFKRLNVRNRAMAVSRGMSMQQSQQNAGGEMVVDGLLERRPCIVLSIALPEQVDRRVVRFMHGGLAALAYDHDALFLARKGNAGDLMFGVQRVTEYDLIKALQAASAIYSDIAERYPEAADLMRGGLTAGLAVASMKRFGGWSGEAVASAAIGMARDLASNVPSGKIAVGAEARGVMAAFGVKSGQSSNVLLSFQGLDSLLWTGERSSFSFVGRSAELKLLETMLGESSQGRGRLVFLRGEAGMGKSRLCHEVSLVCKNLGGLAHSFYGQPDFLDERSDGGILTDKYPDSTAPLLDLLRSAPTKLPELIVVDDFHLFPKEKQNLIWACALNSIEQGKMVIVVARRYSEAAPDQAKQMLLGKQSRDELFALVGAVLDKQEEALSPGGIQSIVDKAAGVPLFAVELAKCRGDWKKALALMIVVSSRLDNLYLDRRLLNAVAKNSGKVTLKDIAGGLLDGGGNLRQNLERAEASGVISQGPDGRLSIPHPLLRQLIEYLGMD